MNLSTLYCTWALCQAINQTPLDPGLICAKNQGPVDLNDIEYNLKVVAEQGWTYRLHCEPKKPLDKTTKK